MPYSANTRLVLEAGPAPPDPSPIATSAKGDGLSTIDNYNFHQALSTRVTKAIGPAARGSTGLTVIPDLVPPQDPGTGSTV